jgi:hypothetical protein
MKTRVPQIAKATKKVTPYAMAVGIFTAACRFCEWLATHPWFKAVASVGLGFFVCGVLFLLYRLAFNYLRGAKLI